MAAAKADKGRRVIGYIRVSTAEQDFNNQRLGILTLANQHGWKVDWVEETASGMLSYQKRKLGEAIGTLEAGNVLIVSELSRLGRSMLEIMMLLRELSEKRVRVFAVKGGYELSGDSIQAKIMAMVLCMASEIERDLISQRTKEALARKKREGVRLGRPKGPGKSKLDDKLPEIKNFYEKGISTASMAKIFDCTWPTMKDFIKEKVMAGGRIDSTR